MSRNRSYVLTESDLAKLVTFRKEWQQIVLSTAPADRPVAEKAITELYRMAGFRPPSFLWVRSPMAVLLVVALLENFEELVLRDAPREPIWGAFWGQLAREMRIRPGRHIGNELHDELVRPLRNREEYYGEPLLRDFWRLIWGHLRSALGAGITSQVSERIRTQISYERLSGSSDRLLDDAWSYSHSDWWDPLDEDSWNRIRETSGEQDPTVEWHRLWDAIFCDLYEQWWQPLRHEPWGEIWERTWNNLRGQSWDQVWNQLKERLKARVNDELWGRDVTCFWGQHDGYWIGTYLFANSIRVTFSPEETRMLELWALIARSCSWWCPYSRTVVISNRPGRISCNHAGNNMRLHCDNGPALTFRDGYSLWSLNGVTVPRTIVETPADKLDPKLLVLERNAEVRGVIASKIGIDRLCSRLGEILDSAGSYQLINLGLGDWRRRPYLKMLNPSTGAIHFEGVPPDILTVREALAWRNGTTIPPKVIT